MVAVELPPCKTQARRLAVRWPERPAAPGRSSHPFLVPSDAPFLFSIAGLSASLAGLAGLVAALKRAEGGPQAEDMYRLRQIVEYSFANVLFAISVIPLSALSVDDALVIRTLGAVVSIYMVATALVLRQRGRRYDLPFVGVARVVVVAGLVVSLATSLVVLISGSMAVFEILLVLLLARPMIVFVLVLSSFESRVGPQRDR